MSGVVNNHKVWVALVLAAIAASVMVVVVAAGARPAHAAFRGSNGAIAFGKNDQIYRMSPDGFGQTQLPLSGPLAGSNSEPTWSSDGKKIAFTNSTNNGDVYWMSSDGSGTPKNLTNNSASDGTPSFFPDSLPGNHKIAFASDRGSSGTGLDIYVMTVDDNGDLIGQLTRMTTAGGEQPAVSPNGKKIAFTREVNGNWDIYVINASSPESSTNKAVRLTKSSALDRKPDWSPSGKQIAFMSSRSAGQYDIFVMKSVPESRTNRPKDLTSYPGLDSEPAWSPDGTKIAFMSDRATGLLNIFTMHADGTHQTDITNSSGGIIDYPSWQPNP